MLNVKDDDEDDRRRMYDDAVVVWVVVVRLAWESYSMIMMIVYFQIKVKCT